MTPSMVYIFSRERLLRGRKPQILPFCHFACGTAVRDLGEQQKKSNAVWAPPKQQAGGGYFNRNNQRDTERSGAKNRNCQGGDGTNGAAFTNRRTGAL